VSRTACDKKSCPVNHKCPPWPVTSTTYPAGQRPEASCSSSPAGLDDEIFREVTELDLPASEAGREGPKPLLGTPGLGDDDAKAISILVRDAIADRM
jgi:hypothetical protein